MNIWENLEKITAQLQASSAKILMLDFDGTLTPIANSPKEAKLSTETRDLLLKICTKPHFHLAIISGRTLKDIKEKIGLRNIIYGGNHGLEGEFFQEKFCYPIPTKTLNILKTICRQLDKIAAGFSGVTIEDKKQGLAFHYRQAKKEGVSEIKSLFKKTLEPYIQKGVVIVTAGKMVFDVTPKLSWNKGHFAKLILSKINEHIKEPVVVVCIGDDTTDENVFGKIEKGITVKVNKDKGSKARYRLKDTDEVYKFLAWINARF